MKNKLDVIILVVFIALVFVISLTIFQAGFNKGVQIERTRIWEKLNYCI